MSTGDLFPDLHPSPPEPADDRRLVAVAVAAPLPDPLTYAVPEETKDFPAIGSRVLVPLGGRRVSGFVVALDAPPPPKGRVRAYERVMEDTPLLDAETLTLGLWVARHYGSPPGEALQALVPAAVRHGREGRHEEVLSLPDPDAAEATLKERRDLPAWEARCRVLRALLQAGESLRRAEVERMAAVSASPIKTLVKAGLVQTHRVVAASDPFERLAPVPSSPPELTADQARAVDALLPRLDARSFHGALLHGVTGSGKTEVYLRLLERVLEQGRGAILLVPEIALTPQTVERLLGRLGRTVAVLHSNLSDGDRVRQWKRLRAGEVRVAVGPRSALFAPIADLGLVILDEEHENTFKQNQSPRYHARDTALERARLAGALVVLGSATPSLESEALAASGTIERLSLPARVGNRPLPDVHVIDMRVEKPIGQGGIFSRALVHQIGLTLDAGEQVVLFLNRRGFATAVACKRCGWRATCERCDVRMTHYRGSDRLLCHYCGAERSPPVKCPDCSDPGIRFAGFGTEKVTAAVEALFPGRRVARMDSETLRRRGAPERLFNELREGRIDVLVGTQSLAKGFDVPNITLVGVVSADTALGLPDFRSSERTFQLLCQVAGRAGRGQLPGKVFIQSYEPDHAAIRAASAHDHDRFVKHELKLREELGYPPFGHLARLVVEGPDEARVAEVLEEMTAVMAALPAVRDGRIALLGPAPCPLAMLKEQHRRHILLLARDAEVLTAVLPHLPRAPSGLRSLLDRDPVALL